MYNTNNLAVTTVPFGTNLDDIISNAQANGDNSIFVLTSEQNTDQNIPNPSLPQGVNSDLPWTLVSLGNVFLFSHSGNVWSCMYGSGASKWSPVVTAGFPLTSGYANFGIVSYRFDAADNNLTAASQFTTPGLFVGSNSLTDKPTGATGLGYNVEVKGVVNAVSGNEVVCFTQTYTDTAGVWIRAYNGSKYSNWTALTTFTFPS